MYEATSTYRVWSLEARDKLEPRLPSRFRLNFCIVLSDGEHYSNLVPPRKLNLHQEQNFVSTSKKRSRCTDEHSSSRR